jgi:hypothetical protein
MYLFQKTNKIINSHTLKIHKTPNSKYCLTLKIAFKLIKLSKIIILPKPKDMFQHNLELLFANSIRFRPQSIILSAYHPLTTHPLNHYPIFNISNNQPKQKYSQTTNIPHYQLATMHCKQQQQTKTINKVNYQ